ncbi:MAG TPA: PEP/pyruvate-binding domain-containing protein [Polyangiaceae bacterium]|nr:PEP/pyruvate-binding domain-containing protein [Polyangiaceae bacterium]
MRRRLPQLFLTFVLTAGLGSAACGDLDPSSSAASGGAAAGATGEAGQASGGDGGVGGGGNGGEAGDPGAELESLPALDSAAQFARLAGKGDEVKYLASVDEREASGIFETEGCVFQNTNKYPYHLQFLRTRTGFEGLSSERYTDLVLRRESRLMWGGSLKLFAATLHPHTEQPGVLAYSLYSGSTPGDRLTFEDLREVDARLKACIGFARDWLVFTPEGAAQLEAVRAMSEQLADTTIAVVEPGALRPGLAAETYSEGEGYGYLKLLPEGASTDQVGPRDVVLIDAAPNDLGLVAGLVTRLPQSLASHLNLRLREKAIPNAAAPGVFDNGLVSAFADRLVRVSARGERVDIQLARLEDAQAFWDAARPALGAAPADLSVGGFVNLEALRAADAAAFGTKAANLGELTRVLPAANRVHGFAIPFSAYAELVERRGLRADIDALIADPRMLTDATHKRARLLALRERLRAAPLLPELVEALRAAIETAYGAEGAFTRLRFRSSTNAEDLPGVSGAGLYDSRSGCLADDLDADTSGPSACLTPEHEAYLRAELQRRRDELDADPSRTFLEPIIRDLQEDLSDEKSAYRALLRVWASLWTERAFDDREYYGIDHHSVFMGVAVHPTFVGEQLESVALTELEAESDEPLYRLVSQKGEVGVVGPSDANAIPEILTFRRSQRGEPTSIALVQPSSLSPGAARLWSAGALEELTRLLFQVQAHFASEVYPTIAPLSLDVELDVTADGRTVFKQARPYTP